MKRLRIALILALAMTPLAGCAQEDDPRQAFQAADTVAMADTGSIKAASGDWPWWRGPNHNGIADSGQQPPTSWSETENVIWKTPIPGRGHSSPIVVGSMVVLATADEKTQTQSVVAFDRDFC